MALAIKVAPFYANSISKQKCETLLVHGIQDNLDGTGQMMVYPMLDANNSDGEMPLQLNEQHLASYKEDAPAFVKRFLKETIRDLQIIEE